MEKNFRRLWRTCAAALRPSYDGPFSWLWLAGTARVALLGLVAVGAYSNLHTEGSGWFLGIIYLAASVTSAWYLIELRHDYGPSATLTWTQIVVDFGVVALTISNTNQQASFFTFLFVVVILEAGVLMGFLQGILFATASTVFMVFLFALSAPQTADPINHYYNCLIQCISFFFAAFISGYWNQRVSSMKQFQRDILDNMNSGFLIADAAGLVIAINRAGCDILNLVERDVVGRHVEGIIQPESGAECPVATALRLKKDFTSYEFHAQTAPDHTKLLGLTTNLMLDSRNLPTGIIATFTDLTEMARMRQELEQQDRMAFIGELSAELAHEIRNPVASIRGAMDEVVRHLDQATVIERLAGIAVRESDHLNEIVTGFLDFARDPDRQRECLDLRDIAIEAREHLLRKYRHESQLTIALEIPRTPCWVLVDRTQIWQVFTNLGCNAAEAMNGCGALTISLKAAPDAAAPRTPVEVRFEDEGPGIPPDKVARIFEPFYTEKERGVGMGLAICMRIVTAHNGTLQAALRPGGGAAMIMRLPAAPV